MLNSMSGMIDGPPHENKTGTNNYDATLGRFLRIDDLTTAQSPRHAQQAPANASGQAKTNQGKQQ